MFISYLKVIHLTTKYVHDFKHAYVFYKTIVEKLGPSIYGYMFIYKLWNKCHHLARKSCIFKV